MASIPELQIMLHNPRTFIYTPGSTVSGSTIFIPHFNARLRCLIVSLKGVCYTSFFAGATKVSHTVPFLHLETSTFEGTYTNTGSRYEAPFSFTIPQSTEVTHEAGPDKLQSLFNQGPQSLPDSTVISARRCVQMVRYYVEVEVHGRLKATSEETILFRQSAAKLNDEYEAIKQNEVRIREGAISDKARRPSSTNPSDPLGHRDTWRRDRANRDKTIQMNESESEPKLVLHALPMVSAHDKSRWERYRHVRRHHNFNGMRWLLKSWKAPPQMVFMPSIYCPLRVTVGQQIPVLLAVDTLRDCSSDDHHIKAPLILESFSLAVTAHTRTIMQNHPTQRSWGCCLELSYVVLQASGLSTVMALDQKPISLVQNFKILPGTIPSFSTYTINREYSIDMYFKFRFNNSVLEWGTSTSLSLAPDLAIDSAGGQAMDPMIFVDPKKNAQYFWGCKIEAGAAESTGRTNIFPDNPDDTGNVSGMQWDTGRGRLPRTSYACATAQVREDLTPVGVGKGAFSIVAGISGKPSRRILKDVEPMTAPLIEFRHKLGLDRMASDVEGTGRSGHPPVVVDGCADEYKCCSCSCTGSWTSSDGDDD